MALVIRKFSINSVQEKWCLWDFAEYVFRRYAAKELCHTLPNVIAAKFISTEDVSNKSDISVSYGEKYQFKSEHLFRNKTFEPKVISSSCQLFLCLDLCRH